MNPQNTTIVEQLRKAIKARSKEESQYAIAKSAGIHSSVMSRFMRQDRDISFETAAKLCDHLGLVLSKRRA
jgi:plasmid maintenance system antidote protein VapI